MVHSLTLDSKPTTLQLMPVWNGTNAEIFSVRHIPSLIAFRNTRQLFSITLAMHCGQWGNQQRHSDEKSVGHVDSMKTACFQCESWDRKAGGPLAPPQLGPCTGRKSPAALHVSLSENESTMRIDLGCCKWFTVSRQIANLESVSNQDRL